jgi:hypothetical protein
LNKVFIKVQRKKIPACDQPKDMSAQAAYPVPSENNTKATPVDYYLFDVVCSNFDTKTF